ncbi:MAG: STAS domain-containing protein [Polyangia bacterium]
MSEELQAENVRLRAELAGVRDELAAARRKSAQALAGYQQHALNMEIIRQQNEDLTLITQELAAAKAAEEQRTRELESAVQQLRAREQENQELINKLRVAVEQLSTPVLQIWDRVLALPIVGPIDEDRARVIMEHTLAMVTRDRVRHLLIDLTGAHRMDAATARHLLRLASAVRLMGAGCTLCGLSAEAAHAITRLGLSLGDLHTDHNLYAALAALIRDARPGSRAAR